MNKQKRIKEITQIICDNEEENCFQCEPNSLCPKWDIADKIVHYGYIDGADFVHYLKAKLKEKQNASASALSRAYDICLGIQSAIDILDEALQEYLK